MSNFQSIPPEYRITDVDASGIPILEVPTLPPMREKERSEFGWRLYEARKRAGLTQVELAKRAGFGSQGSIAELEKLGQGSSHTPMLATALGVTPEWLATGDENQRTAWPFSADLFSAISGLAPKEVEKLEGVMRAHLGILPSQTQAALADEYKSLVAKIPPKQKRKKSTQM